MRERGGERGGERREGEKERGKEGREKERGEKRRRRERRRGKVGNGKGRVRRGKKYLIIIHAMLQTHMYTCHPPTPAHTHIHTSTHPSWVVMVTMYSKHRDRHIVVWIFVVHNWKPVMKTNGLYYH